MGFGSYAPENAVTNHDLTSIMDTSDEWIVSRTGISERRISLRENTSQMCTKAAKKILDCTGVAPEEIDVVIIATISPDYTCPSTACLVQDQLGLTNAFAFDVAAACSGFVYSLVLADRLIKGGEYKNALVLGGETISKYLNWEDRGTAVIFGDGAGGVLLSACEGGGILASDLNSNGQKWDAIRMGCTPVSNAFNGETYDPNVRLLKMDGRSTFDFVVKNIPQSIQRVLDKAGLTLNDIKYIVPHQANSRIVEGVAKKLGVGMEMFYLNISRFGNTSSASIPLALDEMADKGLIKPGSGDKIILTGFGGGLTWGSVLVEL